MKALLLALNISTLAAFAAVEASREVVDNFTVNPNGTIGESLRAGTTKINNNFSNLVYGYLPLTNPPVRGGLTVDGTVVTTNVNATTVNATRLIGSQATITSLTNSSGSGTFNSLTMGSETLTEWPIPAEDKSVGDVKELLIPNHTGYWPVIHPSVIALSTNWPNVNGYRYWMAFTPLDDWGATNEWPNIAASHDGVNWETPPGLVNPVAITNASTASVVTSIPQFYPDPELKIRADGTMILYWLGWGNAGGGATWASAMYKTSTNGINWSSEQTCAEFLGNTAEYGVGPNVIIETNRSILMFSIRSNGVHTPSLGYVLGDTSGTNFNGQTNLVIPTGLPTNLWHFDFFKAGLKYYILAMEETVKTISLSVSTNLTTWEILGYNVVPFGQSTGIRTLYTPAVIVRNTEPLRVDLYVSGWYGEAVTNIYGTSYDVRLDPWRRIYLMRDIYLPAKPWERVRGLLPFYGTNAASLGRMVGFIQGGADGSVRPALILSGSGYQAATTEGNIQYQANLILTTNFSRIQAPIYAGSQSNTIEFIHGDDSLGMVHKGATWYIWDARWYSKPFANGLTNSLYVKNEIAVSNRFRVGPACMLWTNTTPDDTLLAAPKGSVCINTTDGIMFIMTSSNMWKSLPAAW